MESIWDVGISMIVFLQSIGSWLEAPMKFFSFLGQEEFYLLVAPAIYWCLDSAIGIRLALWLMVSSNLNSAFKILFADPRPYWYSTQVTAYAAESSFGLPSGHAQNSVVVFAGMGWLFKRRWLLWAGGILAFLIGLSRMYLAVHFPIDVLLGWLIGLALLWLLLRCEKAIVTFVRNQSFVMNALAAFISSMVLLGIVLLFRQLQSGWVAPAAWLETIAVTYPNSEINPLSIAGSVSNAAAFFGLALGAFWTIKSPLTISGLPWQKLLARYILGVVGVLIFWYGLKLIPLFASGEDFLSLAMRYIRYGLVGFWVTGLGPTFFRKMKI